MASLKTLNQLIELAEQSRENAAQQFAKIGQFVKQQTEKLDMLYTYRVEYQDRMRRDTMEGLHGAQINNYSRFIAQLSQAIEQQETEVDKAKKIEEEARQLFMAEERKLKSFQTLHTREQQKLDKISLKRDQLLMDEYGLRRTTNSFMK